MSFPVFRIQGVCLAAFLLAGAARAETADEAAMAGVPIPAPVRDCIQRDSQGRFTGWVDEQHCLISGHATAAAQWLDGVLAGGERTDEAGWQVRTTAYQQWDEELGWRSGVSFRSSIELPQTRRKLRLVFSEEEDRLQQLNRGLATTRAGASAALRWLPRWDSRVKYSFDVGVRSRPEAFARMKAQRGWRMSDEALTTLTQTLDYGGREHGRSLTELAFDHALDGVAVLRLVSTAQYRESESAAVGLRWGQDILLLQNLGERKSITYGITFDGVRKPEMALESRGIFLLYRQSVWRPWLFVEAEPHLARYRSLRWDAVPSVFLRLEAQFGQ